jgi:hypothetical protein
MKNKVLLAVALLAFSLVIPVLGTLQSQRGVASYGTIDYTSSFNILVNPDFSQGFARWSDVPGWNGAQGWASLDYSNYHNAAPSLKMTPDPYYIAAAAGMSGDCGSAWADQVAISPGCIMRIGVWVKTDTNPSYPYNPNAPYGARLGCDFRESNTGTILGGFTIINSTVPVIDYCPVVSWGTSDWTLMEYYVRAPSNAHTACVWLQTFPQHSNDFHSCYFDDVYAVIVG